MRNIEVPFVDLSIKDVSMKKSIIESIEKVLDTGMYVLGPEVKEFERRFAEYSHAKYAISVDNGTSALIR